MFRARFALLLARVARRRVTALVAMISAVGATAMTVTPAAADDVAAVSAATPVSAWGGYVLWSAYDASTQTYALTEFGPSGLVRLPVPVRRAPFDVDVGPDRNGRPAAVYSRCARDAASPLDLPSGCDVWKLDLTSGREQLVRSVSSPTGSETTPSIWRGRIAFARRYERGRGLERRVAILYVQRRASSRRLIRLPGGPIPRCEPAAQRDLCEASIKAGPASLDLAGRRLAFRWLHVGGSTEGVGLATEVGIVDVTRSVSQLLDGRDIGGGAAGPCDLSDLFAPEIVAGAVQWLVASNADCPSATSTVVRRDLATGSFTAAAVAGTTLALAVDDRQTWALEVRGPAPVYTGEPGPPPCAEPGRSCALTQLGPLTFAPTQPVEGGAAALCATLDLRRPAKC